MHGKTEESPVAEHFNGEGYNTLADMTVMVIQPQLMPLQDRGKQVVQDPWNLISFGNEPQDGFPVKPTR